MISDVIWHRLVRMEEKLAESKTAYDAVDEPALIAALEVIEQLSKESLQLARRRSRAIGLHVVREPPVTDDGIAYCHGCEARPVRATHAIWTHAPPDAGRCCYVALCHACAQRQLALERPVQCVMCLHQSRVSLPIEEYFRIHRTDQGGEAE